MKIAKTVFIVLLFVIGLTIITYYTCSFFFKEKIDVSNLGEMLSGITAAIAAFYVMIQYQSYLKDKKNNQLSIYNKRFAEDKYIAKVTKWMINSAKYDENGRIVGKNKEKIIKEEETPDTYDKEMFMRFFEELNVQINNHLLNEEDTLRLFAYYALVFDEYKSFREEITDYDKDDLWMNFHKFIDRTKQTRLTLDVIESIKKEYSQ